MNFISRNHNDLIALRSKCGDVYYSEIIDLSENFSDLNVERQVVLLLCSNTISAILGYIIFIENGIVPILLKDSTNQNAIHNIIEKYHINLIWCEREKFGVIDNSKVIFEYRNNVLIDNNIYEKPPLNAKLALLLSTSGSTGDFKMVRVSYDNLCSNADSISEYLEITPSDVAITSLPIYYSFGLSVVNSNLRKGSSLVVTDSSVMQKDFWEVLKSYNVSILSGVPYTYEMLNRLRFTRNNFPSLKLLCQAGGHLRDDLALVFVNYAKNFNKKFFIMYGQTEATARISYVPPDVADKYLSSIGKPIPNGELRVVDEQGNTISQPYVTGELVYNGPNVTMGYSLGYEDLCKGSEWLDLHTGDLGYFDEFGMYFLAGRLKRIIKIHGNRISLDVIENFIVSLGHCCACTGVDDTLFVVIQGVADVTSLKKIIEFKYNLYHNTVKVFNCKLIPRFENGKIDYSRILEMIKNGYI